MNIRQRSIPIRAQVLYNAGMDDEASDILPIAKEKVAGAQRTGEAIEFLVRAVGKKESIKKIISQCPQILERNVSDGLQPTYDFLIMIYGEDTARRLEFHRKDSKSNDEICFKRYQMNVTNKTGRYCLIHICYASRSRNPPRQPKNFYLNWE